jgi:hypothetical protein
MAYLWRMDGETATSKLLLLFVAVVVTIDLLCDIKQESVRK